MKLFGREPVFNLVKFAEDLDRDINEYNELDKNKVKRRERRAIYKDIKRRVSRYNKAVGFTAIYF